MFKGGQASLCQVRTKLELAFCNKSRVCDENYNGQFIRGYINIKSRWAFRNQRSYFQEIILTI